MKGYIEERAVELANYIIERKTTVRAAAKKYGISKSTVHMVVAIGNGIAGLLSGLVKRLRMAKDRDILRRSSVGIGGGLL